MELSYAKSGTQIKKIGSESEKPTSPTNVQKEPEEQPGSKEKVEESPDKKDKGVKFEKEK